MGSFSDYTENKVINHITGKEAFATVSPCWVALTTNTLSDSSVTGTNLTEPATTYSYWRKQTVSADWNNASGGSTSNATALSFPTCTSTNWGTLTHFALVDTATPGTGNVVAWAALNSSKTINVNDTAQFAIGTLTLSID